LVRKIGTLNEKPLHEALKQWYAQPNDLFEQSIDGFVIDIVHGDLLIEIQTQSFTAIRRKLKKLLAHHQVRLVYPIPCEKWIPKQPLEKMVGQAAAAQKPPSLPNGEL
jgi:hypothetical protein